MIELTTISWWTLLLGIGFLFLIWLLTTRTRYGRLIINRETPWNTRQWTTILIIIAITMFILVNPVFHLMTTGIFAILYYIFVSKNALGRNLNYLGKSTESLRSGLDFTSTRNGSVRITCKGKDFSNKIEERRTLDKCLFSFLGAVKTPIPKVDYIDGEYHIQGDFLSKKYYSSLIQYIQNSGFEIEIKNIK